MLPMYRQADKLLPGYLFNYQGKWLTVVSVIPHEGTVEIRVKENGDVLYIADTGRFQIQIPGMMS